MLIAPTAASSPISLSLVPSQCLRCQVDPIGSSTSYSGLSFRNENRLFGTTQLQWLHLGHDIFVSRVPVAADYSDSIPNSSGHTTHHGYHPLEELKECRRVREEMPTSAEIARTAVEANNRALLVFPGIVHCEPHEQISWSEFQYVIDDFGDIFFEIYNDQNILRYQGASNPVNALIGMDISQYWSRKIDLYDDSIMEIDDGHDIFFVDDYFEVEDSDLTNNSVDWGMPENSTWMHPVYFAKCLTKAIDTEHSKLMDYPTNGVSVSGLLKPTFIDEELYLRQLFNEVDSDGYHSDYKDGDIGSLSSEDDGSYVRSTIYRMDVTNIELFSVYGVQSVVDIDDFQCAEPDELMSSTPSILKHFMVRGTRCNIALKALCKKKGIHVERANLIGVDSLGMDVRVSCGTEVRTHRFPFKSRATSKYVAEKQIQQLLYPRSQRKKLGTLDRPTNI